MRRSISRRETLRWLGGLGLIAVVPAAQLACKTAGATDPLACLARSALTEGPYFVDEKLERSDIRADPSDGSVRPGVPLELTFVVQKLSSGQCAPLAGVLVDVWHCDAEGSYSDVGGQKGKKYLRGYQVTDANGQVKIVTIFPGWYRGRAVHVHFKLRTAPSAPSGFEFTSQLFFDESVQSAIYAHAAYAGRGSADTSNGSDDIYNDGGSELLLTPTKSGTTYSAKIVIGMEI